MSYLAGARVGGPPGVPQQDGRGGRRVVVDDLTEVGRVRLVVTVRAMVLPLLTRRNVQFLCSPAIE